MPGLLEPVRITIAAMPLEIARLPNFALLLEPMPLSLLVALAPGTAVPASELASGPAAVTAPRRFVSVTATVRLSCLAGFTRLAEFANLTGFA
ncbi:MAG TPA: hypothetical protein PLU72_08890 [Candidatus Ozemobacteraceae bacterium]|nr:hypothetical protein [Candidatus Ozemobacteraceae bacterium]HQG28823.1 hypothetical protein [Candidatus Ozemobacteraceae bacterium]